MQKKPYLISTLIIVLIISFVFPVAHCIPTEVVISGSLGTPNHGMTLQAVHPSAGAQESAYAQSFNVTTSGYLTEVMIRAFKVGNPVATLRCSIYNVQGTFDDASEDVGSSLVETSAAKYSADLTGAWSQINFSFTGVIQLLAGVKYMAVIYVQSASLIDGSTNWVNIEGESDGSLYAGRMHSYKTSAWSIEAAGKDLNMKVVGLDQARNSLTEDAFLLAWSGYGISNSSVAAYPEENMGWVGSNYTFTAWVIKDYLMTSSGTYTVEASIAGTLAAAEDTDNQVTQKSGSFTNGNFTFSFGLDAPEYELNQWYTVLRVNYTISGDPENSTTYLLHFYDEYGFITPNPTPTPSGWTREDEVIDGTINFMVPVIIMLIPAVLLGFVMKMGKWGYIIGLLIGSGLGWVFVAGFPAWLMFLVVIGTIGFAYDSFRRRGD